MNIENKTQNLEEIEKKLALRKNTFIEEGLNKIKARGEFDEITAKGILEIIFDTMIADDERLKYYCDITNNLFNKARTEFNEKVNQIHKILEERLPKNDNQSKN